MTKKAIVLLLWITCHLQLIGRDVIIEGKQASYSGKVIEFTTFFDPFTGKDSILSKYKVDSSGYFKFVFPLEKTQLVYSRIGAYKGYLHAEPQSKYIITLPEWKDLTPAEKLNPFFEPFEFQFIIENDTLSNSLNKLILKFDTIFFSYLKKIVQSGKMKKDSFEVVRNSLLNLFGSEQNVFFRDYVIYKIGLLELISMQYRVKYLSKQYFEGKPILYNNEAYLDLFNRVYDKYFFYFGQTSKGKSIYSIINDRKSFVQLDSLLQTDQVLLNTDLREMVILKNIHDEFYASRFSRSGLLNILDSLTNKTNNPYHKRFAASIREKITRLMPGYEPPSFSLYDFKGKLINLSDFKGKYVYLNFCSCNSYACLKEFDLLRNLSVKYSNKNFFIITIVTDDDSNTMKPYAEKAGMNWIFLHYGNQPDIIKKYDVRGFPLYYLIGPDGKLLLSPAKSPGEYFELDLFRIMRSRGDM
ncbi:MAG: TlpA family protein disulfide reductase [Bacteroidales bacterium]|nr:TlpA family protein disulfide reductase [Bacteroidales bacterium]